MFVNNSKKVLCGLFSYKPRWGLTWIGWVVLTCVVPLAGIFLVLRVYPFLAVSKPVSANVMVVEGWISGPLLKVAAETFQEGYYEVLYTIGGSSGEGIGESEKSTARIAADYFIQSGVPQDCIKVVSREKKVIRDRTYNNAVALRNWFKSNNVALTSLNVFTEGPHSRRSRYIFEKAFGNDVSIGVVSISPVDYNPENWWRYSEGIKEIISEMAAYMYTFLLFEADE